MKEELKIVKEDLLKIDRVELREALLASGWTPMRRRGILQAPDGRYFMLPERLQDGLDFVAFALLLKALKNELAPNSGGKGVTPVEEKVEALRWLGMDFEAVEGDLVWLPMDWCPIRFGEGHEAYDPVVEVAVRTAVLKKAPGSYAYPEPREDYKASKGVAVDLQDESWRPIMAENDVMLFGIIGATYAEAWINAAVEFYRVHREQAA